MSKLLEPAGIAVIGASNDPAKLGYRLISNILTCGYTGAVYPVNPHEQVILGRPAYPDIASVPDPVDMAFVLVPAAIAPDVLAACGRRGIRNAIVGSGGFREIGPEGALLEARLMAVAHEYGIDVIGPNCIGLINMHLPLQATFLPPPGPLKGDLGFISQSGAICEVVIDVTGTKGIGLSVVASLGNSAGLTETDLMQLLADDPETRAILLYIESIRDGERFVEVARQVVLRKPVIALKVGRSVAGRRAAASHTGAMAGADEAYTAAFRKAGVIQVRNTRELLAFSQVLAWCRPPAGPSVAILSNAGGPGVTGADTLERMGLKVPLLPDSVREALAPMLPSAASTANPVDMLASAGPAQYAASLRILLESDAVHSVIVITPPPPSCTALSVAEAIVPVITAQDKPVVIAFMGGEHVQDAAVLCRNARIPVFTYPEDAAEALAALHTRAAYLRKESAAAEPEVACPPISLNGERGALWATRLVSDSGIPTAPLRLAETASEAVQVFRSSGGAIALKIASPQMEHKSDFGGVLLHLDTDEAVREGFERLVGRVRELRPEAEILGVYAQPMAADGQDLIVGMVRDPQFGPLMMVGAGGVETEAERDLAFSLAPLTRAEAAAMLDRTRAGRRLHGFRSIPPCDCEAAIEALVRLSALAVAQTHLLEIEINPLRIFAPGRGALALDVRAKFLEEQTSMVLS